MDFQLIIVFRILQFKIRVKYRLTILHFSDHVFIHQGNNFIRIGQMEFEKWKEAIAHCTE